MYRLRVCHAGGKRSVFNLRRSQIRHPRRTLGSSCPAGLWYQGAAPPGGTRQYSGVRAFAAVARHSKLTSQEVQLPKELRADCGCPSCFCATPCFVPAPAKRSQRELFPLHVIDLVSDGFWQATCIEVLSTEPTRGSLSDNWVTELRTREKQ